MSLGHVALVWIVNELPLQKLPCGVRLALGFHGEGSWEAILWYFLLYFLWGYYTEILLIWLINILPKAFLPKLRGLGDNLLLPLPHWFYDNKNYKWLLPFFFTFCFSCEKYPHHLSFNYSNYITIYVLYRWDSLFSYNWPCFDSTFTLNLPSLKHFEL